jgi:predicted TIM-barrel fold metal-dependent hydrolase
MLGFYSFVCGGILERFPRLKVAFVEAGADWVVYLLQRMDHYFGAYKEYPWMGTPTRRPSEIVREGNVYMFVEAEEELLPNVIKRLGEDKVMLGADMPHAEERENCLTEIWERDDVPDAIKRKLTGENAIRFYSL